MAGMEFLLIDHNTETSHFVKELRWNEMYYHLANGFERMQSRLIFQVSPATSPRRAPQQGNVSKRLLRGL